MGCGIHLARFASCISVISSFIITTNIIRVTVCSIISCSFIFSFEFEAVEVFDGIGVGNGKFEIGGPVTVGRVECKPPLPSRFLSVGTLCL